MVAPRRQRHLSPSLAITSRTHLRSSSSRLLHPTHAEEPIAGPTLTPAPALSRPRPHLLHSSIEIAEKIMPAHHLCLYQKNKSWDPLKDALSPAEHTSLRDDSPGRQTRGGAPRGVGGGLGYRRLKWASERRVTHCKHTRGRGTSPNAGVEFRMRCGGV